MIQEYSALPLLSETKITFIAFEEKELFKGIEVNLFADSREVIALIR